MAGRQSARMSTITNDGLTTALCTNLEGRGLTRSGTGCFIAVPVWQQRVSKG